ncbi:MAG: phage tail tape measure protein, partial [Phycisphaera sp.]|nr:phage tail tape measure protein [Phycisphaera sp.]
MASTQGIRAGRAFVELFADDSRLVRGLRRAERRLKVFGSNVGAVGRRVTAIGAAAAVPFVGATRVFTAFSDQMLTVKAVTGATEDEFARLTDQAKLLGRTTSFTAAQVAGAMTEL